MNRLIIFLLLAFSLEAFGQSIDTIYLDSKWKKADVTQYTFYRTLTKCNADLYECKDYWKSGEIQMEGKLSALYPETREGKFTWYYKNGSLKQIAFYKRNQTVGPIKCYDSNGSFDLEYFGNLDSLDNGESIKHAINDFRYYLTKKLKYPEKARLAEIEGTVNTQFYIDQNGKVYRFEITKSVSEELDNEAKRVVFSYNKWPIPKYHGKSTMFLCSFPIIFFLE